MIQPRNNTVYEMALGTAQDHFLGTAAVKWRDWFDINHFGSFLGAALIPWDEAQPDIDLLLTTLNDCETGIVSFQMRDFNVKRCQKVTLKEFREVPELTENLGGNPSRASCLAGYPRCYL
jgi:hypothetical protein